MENLNLLGSSQRSRRLQGVVKVDDLKKICRERKYKGFSKYNKYDLIQFIHKMEDLAGTSVVEAPVETPVEVIAKAPASKAKNHTERLGRTVEYYIATIYFNEGIDAIFKEELIDLRMVERDAPLFEKMKSHYPYLMYIGNKDNKYDFKYIDIDQHSETKYVSVKTNFNGSKVCPQVIGQTTLKKFIDYFGIPISDLSSTGKFDPKDPLIITTIKEYIVAHIGDLLKEYLKLTLHCDLIYYNKNKDKKKTYIQLIKCTEAQIAAIAFEPSQIGFSHLEKKKEWNESTTVYYTSPVDGTKRSIGEFQVHNHRNNIKFRWNMVNLLEVLPIQPIVITH